MKKKKEKGRIKKIKVFYYDELSKQAQDRAIEKFADVNVDYDGWNDGLMFDLIEKIKADTGIIIDKKDIYYEIFSRENCIYINSEVLVRALKEKYATINDFYLPKKFGMFCNYLGGGLCSGLNKSDFNTDEISFDGDYDDDSDDLSIMLKEKIRANKEKAIKKKIQADLVKIQDIFAEFYKKLYEEYSYLTSRDSIEDTIKANEYEFLENGDRWF